MRPSRLPPIRPTTRRLRGRGGKRRLGKARRAGDAGLSVGRGLDLHPPPALRVGRRGDAPRPLRGPSAARARRRHHDRSHLAGRADPGSERRRRTLVARGEDRGDLNVFASRRGNWEVMLRGLFMNRVAQEQALPAPPGATIHAPAARCCRLWRAAERYATRARPWSSSPASATAPVRRATGPLKARRFSACARFWPQLRAHPPLEPGRHGHPADEAAGRAASDRAALARRPDRGRRPPDQLAPRAPVAVTIHRASGTTETFDATAAVETTLEVAILKPAASCR